MMRPLTGFLFVVLTACVGPPVQELSDARQAISAVVAAGPPAASSSELAAAQTALASAESHLQAHEYRRAKAAAKEAKRRAIVALNSAH
jgi:Domain of unknown function (DUF4398)